MVLIVFSFFFNCIYAEMENVDYAAALRRLKIISKECRQPIPMGQFLDKLLGEDLISPAQEMALRRKEYYDQIDETFYILFTKNARPTYESIVAILQDLQRNDILEKLYEDFSKSLLGCHTPIYHLTIQLRHDIRCMYFNES